MERNDFMVVWRRDFGSWFEDRAVRRSVSRFRINGKLIPGEVVFCCLVTFA